MTRWKTADIIADIKARIPDAECENIGAGGDVDADNIMVTLPSGGQFWMGGFRTEGYYGDQRDDVDVELVELTCGKDSRGGLHGVTNPEMCEVYGVLNGLLASLGFSVVDCMKDYF